jgi:anti-sigma factor RsiW
MTCRELVEFLMEYLSGELAVDQRRAFEDHLAVCPECVVYVKSYEETVKLGKAAFSHPDAGIPDEVPDDLVKAILRARRRPG